MNLKLVSCRSPFMDDDKIYPPLGLLYLQTAVQNARPDIKIEVTDQYDTEKNEWLRNADVVGVSIMTPQRSESRKIARQIAENRPWIKTIAGGPHVRHYLEDMLREPWDHLVPFDGERAIVGILNGLGERVVSDKMSIADFRKNAVKPARLENADFLRTFKYTLNGRPSTTLLTAQGCPEKCTFCEDAETNVRATPDNVIDEEIDDIVSLGYGGVYIFDDIFALSQRKASRIANKLAQRDLIYRCNGQARIFNEDFARMLGDTGCVEIAFGAESGSQTILDNVRKRTSVQQNYEFVRLAQKYGINVKAFLMLGLPGETRQTIRETEDFIKNSGIDDFQLAVYYPYKGTQIRDAIDRGDSKKDIYFDHEGLGAYGQKGGSTESVIRTGALDSEELLFERDRLVKQYRPSSHVAKWKDKFHKTHEVKND